MDFRTHAPILTVSTVQHLLGCKAVFTALSLLLIVVFFNINPLCAWDIEPFFKDSQLFKG